jgi:hypothetical protein
MTPRQANLLTALGLAGLLATVSLTAPRWSALLREPLSVLDDQGGTLEEAGDATPGLDPEADAARRISVRLYFEARDSGGLLSEEREIAFSDDLAVQLRTLVEELVRGPMDGLLGTIPPQTRVLEVFVTARGVAYVNLSGEAAMLPGGSMSELLSVYSIVNSLVVNFPAVSRVQILVEDRVVTSLAGHVDLSRPLPADMTLVALPAPVVTDPAEAESLAESSVPTTP